MGTSEALKQCCIGGVTYQLVTPSAHFESSYHEYIVELGNEERYPFVLDFDATDFQAYLARVEDFRQGVNLPDGYVASTTYWLVCGNTLLGVANLRQYLNTVIAHVGGHVGVGIRPSCRRKGLSHLLLKWVCEIASEQGIGEPVSGSDSAKATQPHHQQSNSTKHLHVHCYTSNTASKRMIKSVGGVLHSTVLVNSKQGSTSVSRFVIGI
ncbi:MAG: hypothetical protein AXW14_07905 [Alteromonas sp. Nap_26]|nr:MAG: hypothetical protein AXW14_07905 [Alteromonas sp. Nap_26]